MRALNGWGPAALRITGIASLVLLLWNPAIMQRAPAGAAPVVLLDASLSLGVRPGLWAQALDTARALAHGGVILRFGRTVAAFDTTPPEDGASRLAPALTAAAARGGPIVIVTDGAIDDRDALPPDVIARARVVVLGHAAAPDAFVSSVEGPHQVAPGDTVRLRVTYGKAGKGEGGSGNGEATLAVTLAGWPLVSRKVVLPDSGTTTTDLTLPASHFPLPGWSPLVVGIHWPGDSEPRDDSRTFPIEVTTEAAAVVLGAPPDWDATFLARALGDVARVPVRYFTQITPGRWNDGLTLAPITLQRVQRVLRGARLVVEVGDPSRWPRVTAPSLLLWNSAGGSAGDWYLAPAPSSPLVGALAAVPWDSLPPVLAALPTSPDSGATPVLQATRSRRGQPQPVVLVTQGTRGRRAVVNLAGLYRWDFRGGASQQAYRATVAGLVDWLLAGGSSASDWAHPDSLDIPAGLPVTWRWTGPGSPKPVGVTLAMASGAQTDTLRFGADGQAELSLPPGTYRYTLADGHGRGLLVVDQYSDEWRPGGQGGTTLDEQPGRTAAERVVTDWRERWWLFALAIAAFATEWAWRRRMGLP
ncbi:MAG TPA: hypothetical protein VH113_00700 [Gemmatimonadales bacterium]|nr:hypothetical protein [Gemmatimonadales bacterium]